MTLHGALDQYENLLGFVAKLVMKSREAKFRLVPAFPEAPGTAGQTSKPSLPVERIEHCNRAIESMLAEIESNLDGIANAI